MKTKILLSITIGLIGATTLVAGDLKLAGDYTKNMTLPQIKEKAKKLRSVDCLEVGEGKKNKKITCYQSKSGVNMAGLEMNRYFVLKNAKLEKVVLRSQKDDEFAGLHKIYAELSRIFTPYYGLVNGKKASLSNKLIINSAAKLENSPIKKKTMGTIEFGFLDGKKKDKTDIVEATKAGASVSIVGKSECYLVSNKKRCTTMVSFTNVSGLFQPNILKETKNKKIFKKINTGDPKSSFKLGKKRDCAEVGIMFSDNSECYDNKIKLDLGGKKYNNVLAFVKGKLVGIAMSNKTTSHHGYAYSYFSKILAPVLLTKDATSKPTFPFSGLVRKDQLLVKKVISTLSKTKEYQFSTISFAGKPNSSKKYANADAFYSNIPEGPMAIVTTVCKVDDYGDRECNENIIMYNQYAAQKYLQ